MSDLIQFGIDICGFMINHGLKTFIYGFFCLAFVTCVIYFIKEVFSYV